MSQPLQNVRPVIPSVVQRRFLDQEKALRVAPPPPPPAPRSPPVGFFDKSSFDPRPVPRDPGMSLPKVATGPVARDPGMQLSIDPALLNNAKGALAQLAPKPDPKIREALEKLAQSGAKSDPALQAALNQVRNASSEIAQPTPTPAPDPALTAPASDLVRGDQGPDVEQLQNDLVSLGYMTQEEMDTGPGIFGPRTQAALAQFQADHGIDYDGSAYGPQSRAALTQELSQGASSGGSPTILPTGSSDGSSSAQPGSTPPGSAPSSAAPATGPSSAAPANGPSSAAPATGPSNAAPAQGGGAPTEISTVDQANAFFTNQWAGGSQYNTETGVDYGYSDCGPTSTLMIASSLGLTPPPNPATAEDQIDQVRDLALGYDSNVSQGTNEGQMANAISAMGGTSQYLDMDLSQVDQALASGQRVLIAGDPWGAWGADMNANGEYLNHQDPGPHFVAIMGKTSDGQYLVADPLSGTGVIAVSGDQIQQFWNDGAGNSGAMAVGR